VHSLVYATLSTLKDLPHNARIFGLIANLCFQISAAHKVQQKLKHLIAVTVSMHPVCSNKTEQ
jgi:hypothetical protein